MSRAPCLVCKGENLGITGGPVASCWTTVLEKQSKGMTGQGRGQAVTRKYLTRVKKEHSSNENNLSGPNFPSWIPWVPLCPRRERNRPSGSDTSVFGDLRLYSSLKHLLNSHCFTES